MFPKPITRPLDSLPIVQSSPILGISLSGSDVLYRKDRAHVAVARGHQDQQHYQVGTPLCINSILVTHQVHYELCITCSLVSVH
jgi:hypothetical protein